MKSSVLVLCLAASIAAIAQTAAKPATTTKPSATATKPSASATAGSSEGLVKYPKGKTASAAARKTLFSLRVQDLKIGTGAEAEHPTPVTGEDGKPVMGDDGKPKTKAPEPASFPVGMGRMIAGFDQGFTGMRVGGIRRIFIPWQIGYGARTLPDRGADHPGIPAKSDLVFEVELVDMTDLPASPHPNIPSGIPPGVPGGPAPPKPTTPPAPSTPPSTPPTSSQPSTPQPN